MDDINQILDNEIIEIENKILEKVNNDINSYSSISPNTEKGEETFSLNSDKGKEEIDSSYLSNISEDDINLEKEIKKTKSEIIQDIQIVEQKLGIEISQESKLKRLTKKDLLKKLAEYINSPESYMKTEAKPEQPQNNNNNVAIGETEYYAKTLVQMNARMVGLFEALSISYKDKTMGVELLEGWSENINRAESELQIVFTEMVKKYGVNIKRYIDPVTHYGMIMTSSAMLCVATNVQKKKKKSLD
jgi:hypothetical protein